VDSFIYFGIIIGKDGETSENVKSRIAKAQSVFFQLKNIWKKSLQTKIRILECGHHICLLNFGMVVERGSEY